MTNTTGEYKSFVVDKGQINKIASEEVVLSVSARIAEYSVREIVSVKTSPYLLEEDSEYFASISRLMVKPDNEDKILIFLNKIPHLYPKRQSCQ
jgi:hypothetical protein